MGSAFAFARHKDLGEVDENSPIKKAPYTQYAGKFKPAVNIKAFMSRSKLQYHTLESCPHEKSFPAHLWE